ncbi:6487_t:CDS:2, partial [Funneliformis caledonium]
MSEVNYMNYFTKKHLDWDVIDFLEKCDLEPFDKKVNQYIRCLDFIADDKDEQVCRRRKADALLKRYRNGSKPDQKRAKDWEQKRKSSVTGGGSSIIIHNSTLSGNSLSGNSLGIGSIARSSVNETVQMEKTGRPTFNVQAPRTPEYQMLSSSSSVPLTIRNESDEETDTDNGGDDEETPDYNDDEVNVEAEQDKQGSRLIIEEINKMKAEYSERYHKIRPENKWKLPSGKFAEDIFYEYTLNLEYESFIIDTSDETIMNLFNDIDRHHINTYNILPEPQVDDKLLDFLLRYREKTPQGLRKLINAGIDLPSYDSQRDFDYHYIHEVFSHLLPRYELRPNDYTNSHLEGWFKTNIWSVIVDCCLLDVVNSEFIRGEGCSRASGQRKNKGRKSSEVRKILGRKCDGILRELGTPDEFAISEEGRLWDGEDGTKYLSDGLRKLPKTMRDTLAQKVKKFKLSSVISHQLEIVGFLHSGQYLQQLVMDIPCGSICRLRRYPSTKIPAKLDEIDELITMVNDMLVAK